MTEAEEQPPLVQTAQSLPVHAAVNRVLADLPAIGKDSWNEQQRFHFRGVDAVLNALNPLLARYGVTIVPHKVIERIADRRQTKSGGVMFEVNLHVQFRLYGPLGDYIEGEAWGEGTDSGDKATGKAHTAAQKAFLIQAFSVSTQEQSEDEPDRHSPEESIPQPVAPRKVVDDLAKRVKALPEEDRKALGADWKSGGLSRLEFGKLLAADVDDATDLVATYEAKVKAEPPTPPAAPPSTPAAGPADLDPGRPFEEATRG